MFEENYSAAVWPSRRWGWRAEIVSDGLTQPITGWGSTWRPTEAMVRAWATRRVRRLEAARDRSNVRLQALDGARAALRAPLSPEQAPLDSQGHHTDDEATEGAERSET